MDGSLCRTRLGGFVSLLGRGVGLEFGAFGLMVLEFGFKGLGFRILWIWGLRRLTAWAAGCKLERPRIREKELL